LYYFVFFVVLVFERVFPVFPERDGRVDDFELAEDLLLGDFLDA
jgi:hypothetical protein